jgi:tetratricopeptide (TPR) repeat protein
MIELLLQAEGALSLGLLDRAEALYRQVSVADPRNSIAVVGLARVCLERQDEPQALELARRALAIDPENAAAQRMTQRLEEVLTYRGITLPTERASTELVPTVPTEPVVTPAIAIEPSPPVSAVLPVRRSLVDRLLRRG